MNPVVWAWRPGRGELAMNRRLEVVLTSRQRRRLEAIRDRPPQPQVGRRAVCLLMSAAGASNRAIGQATGLCSDGVTHIRRRWRARRMASLIDRPRSGRPTKATLAYRHMLRMALQDGPLAHGYLFTVWSVARLNTHLSKATGISYEESRLRKLMHAEGFVFRRPKHTLKGKRNEKAFRRAQRQLTRLKRGPSVNTPTMNSGMRMSRSSISIRT